MKILIDEMDDGMDERLIELGYDAYTHSPVGTVIKAGLQYRF